MKSLRRIMRRYIFSTAAVALVLLLINVIFLLVNISLSLRRQGDNQFIGRIDDYIHCQTSTCTLNKTQAGFPSKWYAWSMLLNETGEVIWSDQLPAEIPRRFSSSEIAVFSHWYLQGYPVFIFVQEEGMLVWGTPKDTVWRINTFIPTEQLRNMERWVPGLVILNVLLAFAFALLFGWQFYTAVRPMVAGVHDLAGKKPVVLPEKGIFNDLAQKINLTSAELQRQDQLLLQRDQARTEWIAGVSHDIRTPLSLIMGYTARLQQKKSLDAQTQQLLESILHQSGRINLLVQDLSLVSKLEYGMQPLNPMKSRLTKLVRAIVVEYLNHHADIPCAIFCQIDADCEQLSLNLDEQLIRRAMFNLLDNATRHSTCHKIQVELKKTATTCQINITDDGTGFPAEILHRFNREDISMDYDNHGLGLAIVQRIMQAHQGKLRIENREDRRGARAILELPLPEQ